MLLYMLLCGKFVTNLWHLRVGIVAQSAVCCVQVGASRWLKFNKKVLFMNRKNVKPVIALMLLALTLIFSGCSGKPMDMKASSLGKLTTFSAETIDGKTFTQDDIAAKDLTVLNFWTTQCGPCIEEMPDLAKFEKSLPDNVTFATVCLLSDGQEEEIRDILKKAGYTGTTLLSGDGDFKTVCDNVQATPTTVVIDSEGNFIGDIVLGGQKDYAKTVLDAMNKALADAGKAEITLAES